MRLHELIRDRLHASGRSMRGIAIDAGVNAGNLSRFLSSGRGLGIDKVDRIVELLGIELSARRYPQHLAWLEDADPWCALLAKRCPDLDAAELRQLVVSILRPMDKRRFLLRPVGNGYAL